jgi:cupin fold WbuC family metalloprotein
MAKNLIDSSQQNIISGLSEAEFNLEEYRSVGKRDVAYLKNMALASPRNRYRLCLHSDQNCPTQEMIICLKGFCYFQPHLHPGNRSESYHIIEGLLDVYLLSEMGEVIETIRLGAPGTAAAGSEDRALMYRLSAPIYHLLISRSEWLIYHEVTTGPWNSEAIRYAPFAPSEDKWEDVNKLVHRVTDLTIEELIK